MKVPAFAGLGQFTWEGVLTTLALLPLAILSTFAGVWIVRRIDAVKFTRLYLSADGACRSPARLGRIGALACKLLR